MQYEDMPPLKPVFNVVPQFDGVIVVQMNSTMHDMLDSFLKSNKDNRAQEFADALSNGTNDIMIVENINDITILILTQSAADDLIDIIFHESSKSRNVGTQIWALKRALEDPVGCQENMRRKMERKFERQPIPRGPRYDRYGYDDHYDRRDRPRR